MTSTNSSAAPVITWYLTTLLRIHLIILLYGMRLTSLTLSNQIEWKQEEQSESEEQDGGEEEICMKLLFLLVFVFD
jgi:hypothetical protein